MRNDLTVWRVHRESIKYIINLKKINKFLLEDFNWMLLLKPIYPIENPDF